MIRGFMSEIVKIVVADNITRLPCMAKRGRYPAVPRSLPVLPERYSLPERHANIDIFLIFSKKTRKLTKNERKWLENENKIIENSKN